MDSDAKLESHWAVKGENVALRKVDPPQVDANDSRHPQQINPKSAISSPYYAFSVRFPSWFAGLTGLPAYISVQIYTTLPSDWLFNGAGGPLVHVDFGNILQFARISDTLIRSLSPRTNTARIVAWGLVNYVADHANMGVQCYQKIQEDRRGSPDPRVVYHAIIACGVVTVAGHDKPIPPPVAKHFTLGPAPGTSELVMDAVDDWHIIDSV